MIKRICIFITSLLGFSISVILFFYQPLFRYFDNKYLRLNTIYTAEEIDSMFFNDAFGELTINAALVFSVALFIFTAYLALSECNFEIIKKCCIGSAIIGFLFCVLALFTVDLVGEGWEGFEAIIGVSSVIIVSLFGVVLLIIKAVGKGKTEYITFIIFNLICVFFCSVIVVITEETSLHVLSVVFISNAVISTINKYVKEDEKTLSFKQRLIAALTYLLVVSCILSFSYYVVNSERKSFNERKLYSESQLYNSESYENAINS